MEVCLEMQNIKLSFRIIHIHIKFYCTHCEVLIYLISNTETQFEWDPSHMWDTEQLPRAQNQSAPSRMVTENCSNCSWSLPYLKNNEVSHDIIYCPDL